MDAGASIIVSGMVQGVGFRYYVFNHASRMGLTGFVKNLYNGDVQIEAEGDRSLIEDLIHEMKIGPRAAHVSDVRVDWRKPVYQFQRFEIR